METTERHTTDEVLGREGKHVTCGTGRQSCFVERRGRRLRHMGAAPSHVRIWRKSCRSWNQAAR